MAKHTAETNKFKYEYECHEGWVSPLHHWALKSQEPKIQITAESVRYTVAG